jgi:hypothetical protein
MPSQGKRLRLRAPKLTLDTGDLLGDAIHGSKSRADALRRYRAKGGHISDARWYGRTEKGKGKQGRPQHSSVYDEAKLRGLDDTTHHRGLDDPSWRGVPRPHEIEDVKVAPYVGAKYEQFVEITGEETTETRDRAGRRRRKGTGIIITKTESLNIPYRSPKPKSKKLKSKRWVEQEILRKYLAGVPRRAASGSLPLKILAVRYIRTHRNIKRPR